MTTFSFFAIVQVDKKVLAQGVALSDGCCTLLTSKSVIHLFAESSWMFRCVGNTNRNVQKRLLFLVP